jgi:2-polyprenyl-3-methyl-5-hydroxy-6-metoxy-1,4-benzoquinol methylase
MFYEAPEKRLYEDVWQSKIQRLSDLEVTYPTGTNRIDIAYKMLDSGGSLLDIGCGSGEMCVLAWKKYKNVIGVDVSEQALGIARKRGVETILANINYKLPLKDGSFDSIISCAVIEHVFDPIFLTQEAYRLLRPGGTFILSTENLAYLPYRLKLLFGILPTTSNYPHYDGGHLHYFTPSVLRRLMEKEGFHIVAKRGDCNRFESIRNLWPSLLCKSFLLKAKKPLTNQKS